MMKLRRHVYIYVQTYVDIMYVIENDTHSYNSLKKTCNTYLIVEILVLWYLIEGMPRSVNVP